MKRRVMGFLFGLLMAALLTACGNGAGGTAVTATGILVDAPVAGISYICGSHTGVTGADGSFTYEAGLPVKFFVGNIVLGETTPKGVVTLMDLVPGATDVTDPAVTKIAQFLQTLDTGATPGVVTIPTSGITASGVPAVNLSQTPNADLSAILTAIGCTKPPVSAATAQANFRSGVFNLYAGTYNGLYSGDTSGTWTLTIDSNGHMTGSADGGSTSLSGSVTLAGASTFDGGGTGSGGVSFTGTIDPATGTFRGTWIDGTRKGQFSGAKAAPSVMVVVSPTSATVAAGGTQQFVATVSGDTNTLVTWSVQETGGGTIDQGGLYTAPGTPGTYHVVAVSKANPAKSATAQVTVTAPAVSTFTVSGTVSANGVGLSGVTVTLTGSGSTGTTTDSSGSYSFTGVQNGSYTLTPTTGGYTFSPAARSVTVNSANLTGQNFTATATVTGGNTIPGLMGGAIQGIPLALANQVTTVAATAGFYSPSGLASDGTNLYIADSNNCAVKKMVIASGAVTTVAGTGGTCGYADGVGSAARFDAPAAVTTDGTNLYVTDARNKVVRSISLASGAVTTLAGAAGQMGLVDGTGSAARFNSFGSITTDGTNLYIVDSGKIRKVVIASGAVTTLVTPGIYLANGITTDGTNLYITDDLSPGVRKLILATGAISTLASPMYFPGQITTDGTNLYLCEPLKNVIQKVVIATGSITTIAGTSGVSGTADGTGAAARFSLPSGITTDGHSLFVADGGHSLIRRIQ